MAYGKQSNFNGRNINAKYTSKEGGAFLDIPYFLLSEKQGDKYPNLTKEQLVELTGKDTWPTEVSGNLIEISVRTGEFEGAPLRSFKVLLEDGDVRNYVEFGLGSINGRNAANSILNLVAFDKVQFSSWSSYDKVKNKSYSKLSVRQGDVKETVKWKFDPKAENSPLPPHREFIGKGGKTERDYTEQEVFFYTKLEEFAAVVKEAAKNAPKASAPAPAAEEPRKYAEPKADAPKAAAPAAQENLDEDVPF